MEEKGELRLFLGFKMKRNPGEVSIDQEQKTEDLLRKQGMSNCFPLKIPVTVNEKFMKANENDELADATSYRSLVGSRLFFTQQFRPVILYDVNILSCFMDKPTKAHMHGAKRTLRYLHGTPKLKIVYRNQEDPVLMGETDADWSGDQNDQKSNTGFDFKYGQHRSLRYFVKSRKQ